MPESARQLDRGSVSLRPAAAPDVEQLLRFLAGLNLPTAGVEEWWPEFTVAESSGELVGAAGIERYADGVLLRSVGVHPAWRGAGLGRLLVEQVLDRASRAGSRDAYLLTTTAEGYFPRLGFQVITRAAVPQSVQQSLEFREACPASAVVMHRRLAPLRVLFVCTGNSARSQIAQALLNHKGRGRFVAESAGSHPAARVHPLAIATLERHGLGWTGHAPQGLDAVSTKPWDFVITVCDRAKETCPILPGQPVVAHWGLPDPAEAVGTEEERQRVFDDTLLAISRRLDLFLALPVEKLEKLALQRRVNEIGGAG